MRDHRLYRLRGRSRRRRWSCGLVHSRRPGRRRLSRLVCSAAAAVCASMREHSRTEIVRIVFRIMNSLFIAMRAPTASRTTAPWPSDSDRLRRFSRPALTNGEQISWSRFFAKYAQANRLDRRLFAITLMTSSAIRFNRADCVQLARETDEEAGFRNSPDLVTCMGPNEIVCPKARPPRRALRAHGPDGDGTVYSMKFDNLPTLRHRRRRLNQFATAEPEVSEANFRWSL